MKVVYLHRSIFKESKLVRFIYYIQQGEMLKSYNAIVLVVFTYLRLYKMPNNEDHVSSWLTGACIQTDVTHLGWITMCGSLLELDKLSSSWSGSPPLPLPHTTLSPQQPLYCSTIQPHPLHLQRFNIVPIQSIRFVSLTSLYY